MRKQRVVLALLLALVMLFTAVSCTGTDEQSVQDGIYSNYRDIPGVTQGEIEAIEELKKNTNVLTYGMLETTETFRTFGTKGGYVSGYSRLMCEYFSQLFDIRFEPEIYDWNTLFSSFEKGKVDFTGELTATPERHEKYIMSDTYTERTIKVFRLNGSDSISEIAKKRNLKYVSLDGATTADVVKANAEYGMDISFAATEEDAIKLVMDKKVDGFLAEEHAEALMSDQIYGEDLFPIVYSPVSISTVKEELKPIITVINKYLGEGGFRYLMDLYELGYKDYQKNRFRENLTIDEKSYIETSMRNGGTVSLLAEDNYPLSFYNTKEEEWQGSAFDILSEVSDITGLRFEVINQPLDPWSKIIKSLENGEGHIVTELQMTAERKGRFLWTDQSYMTDNYALLSLIDHEDVNVKKVLYLKVGVIKGSAYEDVFAELFPNHQNIVYFNNSDDAFDGLENKEIELLMGSNNLLLSETNLKENPIFRTNLEFNRTYESYFGFNINEETLLGIVNKALDIVDTEYHSKVWTSKVFDYNSKMIQDRQPYLWGLSFLLIVISILALFILSKNRRMNKKLEMEIKDRTSELEIQTENAQVASKAKSDFLSRMSHEIRTPLNAITGMAEIAKRNIDNRQKTLESIDEMILASHHLLGIVNNILDMSKIESGKFILSKEPFSAKDALSEVAKIIDQRSREKNIEFTYDIDQMNNDIIIGDKLRMNQVLINLLGNAIKFTGESGKVNLKIHVLEESESSVRLQFLIEDTGIGMDGEEIERMFDAFEQADNNIAIQYGGTGLGLAISRSFISEMGGSIAVTSMKDKGSQFSVVLDFEQGNVIKVEGDTKREMYPVDFTGKRILLAEDIDVNRIIFKELLSDTGVEIETAENGKIAYEMFESADTDYYDLIVMDVQMPLMNGYEATKNIRSSSKDNAKIIPIIAMTANAYKEDIDNAIRSGMDDHIAKPINIDEVISVLWEYFS